MVQRTVSREDLHSLVWAEPMSKVAAEIGVSVDRLQQCVEEIHRWCASRWLQLNPDKTELIWFGTAATLRKIKGIIGCSKSLI